MGTNEGESNGKEEIRKVESLAVGEACKAIFSHETLEKATTAT